MNSYELRQRARESLTGNYWPAVLAAFLAGIFGAFVAGGGSFNLNIDREVLEILPNALEKTITRLLLALGTIGGTLGFASFIMGGVIQLGYSQYLLKQHDREITSIRDLFSQFDRFGQAFLQKFLRGLFIFLWSLLLVIPGIIKTYSYAMTPFIMAENPEMTAKEAIAESKRLMDGHKWELFCLGFSFIGWALLAALTLGIGSIFLNPYVEAAYAAFYRDKISPKRVTYVSETPQIDEMV